MTRAPRLAIAWEPRWQGFRTALKPAFGRSKSRLNGECSLSHRGARSTASSLLLHACVIILIVHIGKRTDPSRAVEPSLPENASIVYFSGKLPAIQDAGGAHEGSAWSRGGRARMRQGQEIKIASDSDSSEVVAQVDHLNLPKKIIAPANFVAMGSQEAPSIAVPSELKIPVAEVQAPVAPAAQAMSPSLRHLKTPLLQAQVVPPPVEVPLSKTADVARLAIPNDLMPYALPPAPRQAAKTADPIAEVAAPELNTKTDSSALRKVIASSSAPTVTLARPEAASSSIAAVGARVPNTDRAVGYVISSEVGRDLAAPDLASLAGGSLAPRGVLSPGSGRTGNGSGASSGDGRGAAMNHVPGTGGAMNGRDQGTQPSGKGNSLASGKGGSGKGNVQNAGISISGDTIQLGNFAANPPSIDSATQKPFGPRKQPGITIVATPRSGGAVNRYGALRGDKVYTIYLDTPAGLATLEYTTAPGEGQSFEEELTAPEPITTDLPQNLKGTSFVLRCKMDRDGVMHGFQFLDAIEKSLTPAVIAALENWRFRPVLQNGESVEVDAIVGLNVRTH